MDVDDALKLLGRWSRWQMIFYVILSIVNTFPASWHMLATVFIGKLICFHIQSSTQSVHCNLKKKNEKKHELTSDIVFCNF